MKEIIEKITDCQKRIENCIKILNLDEISHEISRLEEESSAEGFWNDREKATKVMTDISDYTKQVDSWKNLESRAKDLSEIAKMAKESDHEIIAEIKNGLKDLKKDPDKHEFTVLLSGPYDKNNAILAISAGSGGVDAQDWAEMLLRMYLRFSEKQGWKAHILNISSGDEAGIKGVTIEITGLWAYGYLRSEIGVHRLVRISPYDADKARHTSFALVDIIPEIEEKEYELDEKDLRIETFRASGHGGQSVNTTDSAVRITHVPTGVSVSCQKERSQLQNKNFALKILSSRLKQLEDKKQKEKISEVRGETASPEWGSQIRSYVIHPYTMVKDHRTKYETSNAESVLEGNLSGFIESFLKYTIASK